MTTDTNSTAGDDGNTTKPEETKTESAAPATGETKDGGLLDLLDEDGSNEGASAAKAYKPEGIAEHLLGKDDKETIDKLHKAYKGARESLSKTGGKAPEKAEDYTLEFSKDMPVQVQADDKAVAAARSIAHKHGLSQEQFQGFVGDFVSTLVQGGVIGTGPVAASRETAQKHLNEMAEELGGRESAITFLKELDGWGQGLMKRGVLSEAEYSEFRFMMGTPAGARTINKLRALSGEKMIPVKAGTAAGSVSRADLDNLVADPRYKTDATFRADVQKKFQEHFKNQKS